MSKPKKSVLYKDVWRIVDMEDDFTYYTTDENGNKQEILIKDVEDIAYV